MIFRLSQHAYKHLNEIKQFSVLGNQKYSIRQFHKCINNNNWNRTNHKFLREHIWNNNLSNFSLQERLYASLSTNSQTSSYSNLNFDNTTMNIVQSNDSKEENQTEGGKKRRRLTPKKDILTITPKALERIQYLLSKKSGAIGLSVGIRRRGCNGLSYTLDYVMTEPEPGKYEIVENGNVKIFVDQTALFYVIGTHMDYIENEVESKFEWKNPKAKSLCGCGDSFNI